MYVRMRSEVSGDPVSGNAKEFLDIQVVYPEEPPTDMYELSVHVFSEELLHLGADARYLGGDCPRKVELSVPLTDFIPGQNYFVFLYRNCIPYLYAAVFHPAPDHWTRESLEALEPDSVRYFFSAYLGLSSWWRRLHEYRFNRNQIQMLVHHLHHLYVQEAPSPFILVEGKMSQARVFAGQILEAYLNDDDFSLCLAFSLADLLSGKKRWEDMAQIIRKNPVGMLLIEVPKGWYSLPGIRLLDRLAASLRNLDQEGVSHIVFYGEKESMLTLQKCSRNMARICAEGTFLHLDGPGYPSLFSA